MDMICASRGRSIAAYRFTFASTDLGNRSEVCMARVESGRVDLPRTAMILQRGGPVGRFVVQNLTPQGALLTGAHAVKRSAPLRVMLELPSGEALTVGAHVKRAAAFGDFVALSVAFRHLSESSEDRIQEAILGLLDRTHKETHPAVIVVVRAEDKRAELGARIEALGRRVLLAEAPLSALRLLDDPREHVDAIIAGDDDVELLHFVAESFPSVRALLFVEDRQSDPAVPHPAVSRCGPEHLRDLLL